jgi:hypothetical protein
VAFLKKCQISSVEIALAAKFGFKIARVNILLTGHIDTNVDEAAKNFEVASAFRPPVPLGHQPCVNVIKLLLFATDDPAQVFVPIKLYKTSNIC